MAILSREDLRVELLRTPLLTETALRSVLREELGDIVALLQQALRAEIHRARCNAAERLSSKSSTTGMDTSGSTGRSVISAAEVKNHRLSDAVRKIGMSNEVDIVQDATEDLSDLSHMMIYQVSGDTNECESIGLEAPPRTQPEAPISPALFLPGEVCSPKADPLQETDTHLTVVALDPLREAATHSPVVAFSLNADRRVDSDDNSDAGEMRPSETTIEAETVRPARRMSLGSTSSEAPNLRTLNSFKVRQRTLTRQASENRLSFREWASRIVNHSSFDYLVAALILLNGVLVGVQTDYLARELTDEAPMVFQVLEIFFCLVFTLELGLRLFAYGCKFFTKSDKIWNFFDLFVVTAQILEICMSVFASGLGVSFNLLRVLRLIRVIRLARALRLIGELRTIVSSIAGSMKPLFWTGVLLFMVVYVLGVYTTQVVLTRRITYREDHETPPPVLELYWGNLIKSIMSLFQSITGGIDWDQVARPLIDHISPEMGVLFCLYISFSVFCMLNVVTGVFIESVMKYAKSEQELRAMNHVMHLFSKLDVNHTGVITWETFERNLGRKEMQEFFKTIDVDIESARTLFELLDVDSSGSVDAQEFMDGCLRIWSPTKGLDLRMILRDVNKVLALLLEDKEKTAASLPASEMGRL